MGRAAGGDEDARAGEEDRDCVRRFQGAFLKKLTEEHPIAGAEIEVIPVENRFFGPSVAVRGW